MRASGEGVFGVEPIYVEGFGELARGSRLVSITKVWGSYGGVSYSTGTTFVLSGYRLGWDGVSHIFGFVPETSTVDLIDISEGELALVFQANENA